MAKISNVKQVTKFSWPVVGGVIVGLVGFGALVYGVRKLPDNQVTTPVKKAANAVVV